MQKVEKIIFFDGICNLCNNSVQRVIENDSKNIFKFASLQSDFAIHFFETRNYKQPNSIIYWDGTHFYDKSSAALKVSNQLKFPYPILSLAYIFPKFIRNWVYDIIAKNRYRWFGKSDHCMLPTLENRQRFLG